MKISFLQNTGFDGPGEIAAWAADRGHAMKTHRLHAGEPIPEMEDFDLLVILGGEMNIYQYRDFPWLKAESSLIRSVLQRGKPIVGVCLGAQFIADALGTRVTQNAQYEIGWLPIRWTETARARFPRLVSPATVLHWHGDAFALPAGATRLAESDGCAVEGFLIEGKCLAVQFHPEINPLLMKQFVESLRPWPSGLYVQTAEDVLRQAPGHFEANRQLLHEMFDGFCATLDRL